MPFNQATQDPGSPDQSLEPPQTAPAGPTNAIVVHFVSDMMAFTSDHKQGKTHKAQMGRTCAHKNSGDIQVSSPLPQKTSTQPHVEKAQVWTFPSPSRLSVNPQPSSAPPTQTHPKPLTGGWLIPSNARAFKSRGRVTRHPPIRLVLNEKFERSRGTKRRATGCLVFL